MSNYYQKLCESQIIRGIRNMEKALGEDVIYQVSPILNYGYQIGRMFDDFNLKKWILVNTNSGLARYV